MNLYTLAGHTFDLNRLPERPAVLDVGCRGFDFTAGIRKLRPEALIYALDPDPEIILPDGTGCACFQVALVGDDRKSSRYASYSTGEGNMLTDLEQYYDAKMLTVDCVNMQWACGLLPADYDRRWDLVKLDCEGSEFQILENWNGPLATQISVEFHDYSCRAQYPDAYYQRLFSRLAGFGYRVVRHEVSDIAGTGKTWGHWDSLICLEG